MVCPCSRISRTLEAMFSMMVLGFCTGTKLSFARFCSAASLGLHGKLAGVCVGTYQDSLGDAGLDLSCRGAAA